MKWVGYFRNDVWGGIFSVKKRLRVGKMTVHAEKSLFKPGCGDMAELGRHSRPGVECYDRSTSSLFLQKDNRWCPKVPLSITARDSSRQYPLYRFTESARSQKLWTSPVKSILASKTTTVTTATIWSSASSQHRVNDSNRYSGTPRNNLGTYWPPIISTATSEASSKGLTPSKFHRPRSMTKHWMP